MRYRRKVLHGWLVHNETALTPPGQFHHRGHRKQCLTLRRSLNSLPACSVCEQVGGDFAANHVGRRAKRRICQVGVTLRRRCLTVSKYAADEWEAYTPSGAKACERVPEIMDAHVGNSSKLSYLFPLFPEPIEMPITLRGREHPDPISRHPLPLLFKNKESRSRQRDDLCPGFAGLLAQHAKPEIHL